MDNEILLLDEWAKVAVVKALENAVGDDLLESIRKAELTEKYSNGKKLLKWDLINRNSKNAFHNTNIVAEYANRGPWYMVPLVDKKNGVVYSILRQDRFDELHRKKDKRKRAHYIDAFIQMFNFDVGQYKQLSLFDNGFPEDEVYNIVQAVLECLNVTRGVVKRHALILFEEYHFELTAVRCCVVDTDMNIVAEESWSQYIEHTPSSIIDQVVNDEDRTEKSAKPTLGKKARERKRSRMKITSTDMFQRDIN